MVASEPRVSRIGTARGSTPDDDERVRDLALERVSAAKFVDDSADRRPGRLRPVRSWLPASAGLPSACGTISTQVAVDIPTSTTSRTRGIHRPMPTLTEAAIIDALRTVQEPELGRDIVTLNMVKDVVIDGRRRRAHDRADDAGLSAQGRDRAQRRTPPSAGIGVDEGRRHLGRDGPPRRSRASPSSSCRASRTSSPSRPGKGGVGKSTVSVNLAVALAQAGAIGRPARRRHHRPEHPADARASRASPPRARTTRSPRSSATASR